MKQYYLMSLKHTSNNDFPIYWWGPNERGYTDDLNKAGLYSEEQVQANPAQFNNGTDTIAIPVGEVTQKVKLIIERGEHMHSLAEKFKPQNIIKHGQPVND